MDQRKIGSFIACCRKKKELTQAQLAEHLNISNRAVSKWETGKSMPDVSIMPELCTILEISLTELLSGEFLEANEQSKCAEICIFDILHSQKTLIRKKYWSDMLSGAGVGILFSVLYAPDSLKKAIISVISLFMICTGWYLEHKIQRSPFLLKETP